MVNGHREAFRPGQEPEPPAPKQDEPIPYNQVPLDLNGLKPAPQPPPPAAAPPPPPKKVSDDLKGLY
jgi:hypothetical protein